MAQDWPDKIVQQLSHKGVISEGICLILGASDTGKTTLAEALTKQLVKKKPVGIVDADIGQSHIGPPTTVGWTIVDNPQTDFSHLSANGISFVGHITPVGHLLQLTSAIIQCVQQASKLSELILIDTPGLVRGQAARALWWTIQQILKPKLILAVQRKDELSDILAGLRSLDSAVELIQSPPEIPIKSPAERKRYRQSQFNKYFENSQLYNIRLSDISIQSGRHLRYENLINQLVGLRDANAIDLAIGIINDWQDNKDTVVVRAPKIDIQQVRCLIIGDITIETCLTTVKI